MKISIKGSALLDTPIFNKGSAFPEDERRELGLLGLLRFHSSRVEEQLTRTYENYKSKDSDIERYGILWPIPDATEPFAIPKLT